MEPREITLLVTIFLLSIGAGCVGHYAHSFALSAGIFCISAGLILGIEAALKEWR